MLCSLYSNNNLILQYISIKVQGVSKYIIMMSEVMTKTLPYVETF